MLVEEWCNLYNLKETSVKGLISYKQDLKKLCYMAVVSVPSTHYSGVAITKNVRKIAIKDPELFMDVFNKYARKKAKTNLDLEKIERKKFLDRMKNDIKP